MDFEAKEFTHKGWFLFCPLWVADPYDEIPMVIPRYGLSELLWLANLLFDAYSWFHQKRTGEPALYPLWVSREPLEESVWLDVAKEDLCE